MGFSSPISHQALVALNTSLLGTLFAKRSLLYQSGVFVCLTQPSWGAAQAFSTYKVVDHLNVYQCWQFQFRNLERDLAFSEIVSNL